MRQVKIFSLIRALVLCFAAAVVGSLFTFQAIPTWYAALTKPIFSPPNWIFGPVWTILYILMGISLYLIWEKKGRNSDKKQGLAYFYFQLVLNAFWSIEFFGLHSPFLGFLTIIALWFAIYKTMEHFLKISKIAGWILAPYLIWVSFAALLNLSIMLLNP